MVSKNVLHYETEGLDYIDTRAAASSMVHLEVVHGDNKAEL